MRILITLGVAGLLMAAAGRVNAYQLLLPLNTNTSTLQTKMKVSLGTTTTSTDTVPVSGFLLLDLDTNTAPAQLSLRNLDIHALRSLKFTNTILLLAKLYTTVSNVQVYYWHPGPQAPYFPVTAGSSTLQNVPFLLKGMASYTGGASGTLDLYSPAPQYLTNVPGTLQILNGTNSAHVDFTFAFAEMTITNPAGIAKVNISGTGSLNAQALVNARPPPAPTLAGGAPTGRFVLRWPSSLWRTSAATNTPAGYWLYRTTDLKAASGWEREPTPVNDDGTGSTVEVTRDATQRFYRLEWK